MIALNNGDKIRGDASAATVVDFTLHGVVATVITQLADGQLAASIGDLYTAGEAGIAVMAITLVNTDTSTRTVNLYLTPSGGTARRLIPKNTSLLAGYALHTNGVKCQVMDTNGRIIQGWAIDDTPVDGETSQPISSNWAFDHVAASDPHTGYRLESADHSHQTTGAEAGQLDHGLALDGLADDDHTQYRLESVDHTHQSTGAEAGQLDHGLALTGLTDDDHTQYIKHALATAANDFLVASGSGAFVKQTLAQTKATLNTPTIVRKTADETVNNSNVLQNDNHLLLTVGANEIWHINLMLRITTTAVADIRIAFTVPTAATIKRQTGASGAGFAIDEVDGTTAFGILVSVAMTSMLCILHYLYIGGAHAGNVQFQWAQGTAEVSDTTIHANSFILAHKLA